MSVPKSIRVTEILQSGIAGTKCEYVTVGKEYRVLPSSLFGPSTVTGVSVIDDEGELIFVRIGTSIGHGIITEVVS